MRHYMKDFKDKQTVIAAINKQLNKYYQNSIETANRYQVYEAIAFMLEQNAIKLEKQTRNAIAVQELKKAVYFSMEFLIGRLITSNLHQLGVYDLVKEALADYDLNLNEIEHEEHDAGLGNGGLGRLGACFLDSSAALGLPLYGNSLRYKHGFFKQTFENFKQVEKRDNWLDKPFIWEERKEEQSLHLPFFGYVDHTKLINPTWVKVVPYDVKVYGGNNVVTNLRLWATEPSELQHHKDENYDRMVSEITDVLYPDDSHEHGKTIRLMQQYTFSAAGIQSAIYEHKFFHRSIKDLPKFYVFQINDTHPTLIIAELMRILMDEEKLSYDDAWNITTKMCAFTNHTILSEALEKWNIHIFRTLLPRIYEIIIEIDRRFRIELKNNGSFNHEQIQQMAIVGDNHIRMAHLCIHASFSVNGVAWLHTEILKHQEMKLFYQLYPSKFNNKTNGVTHRRWLYHSNKELTKVIDDRIGLEWRKDFRKIKDFIKFAEHKKTQEQVFEAKQLKKQQLADYIKKMENIEIDSNSIFDVHVKRLHEYKRQLLNILQIIHLYLSLKENEQFKKAFHPQTFIFGAKAAPSYHMAKAIIELIQTAQHKINADVETNKHLKVVFVTNYNVTYAEKIMPAADLSEQISTASKEASGTGNMKFMMNGALTIGTMDGANVEIVENVGKENAFIFGLSSDEIVAHYHNRSYHPQLLFEQDENLKKVFSWIRSLSNNEQHFDYILNDLINHDPYFVIADFDAYLKAQQAANKTYKDKSKWLEMSIKNIASSGFFTSDRTILDYNRDIWHLEKVVIK